MSGLAGLPFLGVGIGYRPELHADIGRAASSIDWIEVISEHYVQTTPERFGRALELSKRFPVVPHGIDLSIGADDGLDPGYLEGLAEFVAALHAPWFSDHLCFTRAGGIALGQLTPILRTRQAAVAVAAKARLVQERVGVPFLLENITYYVDFQTELSESEFVTEVITRADCGLLLDLTNLHINSVNHRFDPLEFLDRIPLERVVQVHLAGGHWLDDTMVDSHTAQVHEEVWDLLEYLLPRSAVKGILVERDQNFPAEFSELTAELDRARRMLAAAVPA